MIFGRGFPLQCFPFPHKKTAIRLPKSAKIFFFATAIQYTSINERQNITPDFNPVSRVQHIPGPRTKFQLKQQPTADRVVPFRLSDKGITHKYVEWGADIAWLDENNLRRSAAFMGKDNLDVVRTSFQPDLPIVDGKMQQGTIDTLQMRVNMFKWVKPDVKLMINCDAPFMSTYYTDENGANAAHWAEIIDLSTQYYQDAGYEVVSVAPFNEPDYLYNNQGSPNEAKRKAEFAAIITELKQKERFNNIRMCGGNTLNSDQALPWYNYLKDQLDEGNTHQLAGSFDNFAQFFTTVREDGKHATGDEMHNVMEAMVGLEYGMQTGIWWGWAEYTRGEFCKASHGERLAYAEHRPNWTAASVYRAPDGKVQAFGGTSERQAVTTSYRFLSKERDVFFDGHGPQREYVMELPGGKLPRRADQCRNRGEHHVGR